MVLHGRKLASEVVLQRRKLTSEVVLHGRKLTSASEKMAGFTQGMWEQALETSLKLEKIAEYIKQDVLFYTGFVGAVIGGCF